MLFGQTRDDKIQELFEQHIMNTALCAEQLQTLFLNLSAGPDFIGSMVQKIVEMEHTGDDFREEIHLIVDKTFITRLHKDDIDRLVHELDRVIDLIKKVVLYAKAYHVTESRAEAVDFCRIILEQTKLLVTLVEGLRKPDVLRLREQVSRIEDLEQEADLLLNTSLGTLFETVSDAKTILEWQSLLEKLEEVTDSCHHVASIAVSIARKES
jgi:uncharacterized protein Yka (UPF0111/DUF47 family)